MQPPVEEELRAQDRRRVRPSTLEALRADPRRTVPPDLLVESRCLREDRLSLLKRQALEHQVRVEEALVRVEEEPVLPAYRREEELHEILHVHQQALTHRAE